MAVPVVTPIGCPRDEVLSAALDLFVYHGVSGTSLQMVADALGVSKAAIHHQFETKSDLILAVLTPALEEMNRLTTTARAQRSVARRREVMLSGLVNLVVANRRLTAVMHSDPIVSQLVREHPGMRGLRDRISLLLTGPDPDAETLVSVAVLAGGLMTVGLDPALADLDDESLRRHLLGAARRVLHLRTPPRSRA